MQEYRSLALIVLSIFAVTLLGAYVSPTFQEQQGYLEFFFLFTAVIFIVSILTIFATLGFSSCDRFFSLKGPEGDGRLVGVGLLLFNVLFPCFSLIIFFTKAKETFDSLTDSK